MRKRRAIVIDDEQTIVNLFRHFLATRNYEVFSYTKPVDCPIRDAKGTIQGTDCPCADIVITDFMMVPMNGLELLQKQLKFGCPILKENKAVMSGFIDQETHKKVKQGGYQFFQKPIDFSALSTWLEQCEKRMDLSRPLGSRRKEMRHDTDLEILFLMNRSDETVIGTAINISNSGLCLKLTFPLKQRQKIHFKTDSSFVVPCSTGSVLWSNKTPDGSFLTGMTCIPEPRENISSRAQKK